MRYGKHEQKLHGLNFTVDIQTLREEYTDIKNHMISLDGKQSDIEAELDSLRKSAQYNSDQQEDINKTVESLSNGMRGLKNFEEEIAALKTQNKQLKQELDSNNQRERLLNLEIVGVPERKDENLTDTILKLSLKAGVNVIAADITFATRVSPKSKVQGRPRPIVVKMNSRLLKDNFLSGARKTRLTTKDLNFSSDPKPIYINEHLTVANKILLKRCKELAALKQFQFVWSKHGRIFIRKNETAPALQIFCDEDLKKFT